MGEYPRRGWGWVLKQEQRHSEIFPSKLVFGGGQFGGGKDDCKTLDDKLDQKRELPAELKTPTLYANDVSYFVGLWICMPMYDWNSYRYRYGYITITYFYCTANVYLLHKMCTVININMHVSWNKTCSIWKYSILTNSITRNVFMFVWNKSRLQLELTSSWKPRQTWFALCHLYRSANQYAWLLSYLLNGIGEKEDPGDDSRRGLEVMRRD